jgi:hypothetical protein
MQEWWAESSKNRTGPGRYRAEDFGLDLAEITKEFAFYNERFEVPVEANSGAPAGRHDPT